MVAEDGTLSFSLTRLGREMGCDPTAIYRHFRNKDELMLAMADAVFDEAFERVPVTEGPIELLRATAWALRGSYLARPALAVMMAPRFTGGDTESQMTAIGLEKLIGAGLDPETAGMFTRAFAETILGHIMMSATLMLLTEEQLRRDIAFGRRMYGEVMPQAASRPVVEAARTVREDADQVFHLALETYLTGIESALTAAAADSVSS